MSSIANIFAKYVFIPFNKTKHKSISAQARRASFYWWVSLCFESSHQPLLTLTGNKLSSNLSSFCILENADFQYKTDLILPCQIYFHGILLLKFLMLSVFRKNKHLAWNCNFTPTKRMLQQTVLLFWLYPLFLRLRYNYGKLGIFSAVET